jgi:hypothetical protein
LKFWETSDPGALFGPSDKPIFFLLFFIGIDQLFFVFVSFFGGGGGGEKKEKAAEFIFFVCKLSGWKIRMKYLKSE